MRSFRRGVLWPKRTAWATPLDKRVRQVDELESKVEVEQDKAGAQGASAEMRDEYGAGSITGASALKPPRRQ
jgi:hypothetical protein